MNNIPEPDWKIARKLYKVLLQRKCERILNEVENEILNNSCNHHGKYLNIYELINTQNKEVAESFDDLRRSNAITYMI